MKKSVFLIIIVVVILVAAGVLRLINNSENSWVCEQGEWIEQGSPMAPKPSTLCTGEKIDLEKEPVQKVEPLVGGDRDEHGCIGSAGYSWCEDKQKCLRVWEEACEITITKPQFDDLVVSPLTVTGEAKGTWFFEAVIPIKLVDKDNNVILSSYGQTKSDWMTEEFIPFEAVLDFNTDATEGYLIIEKNNPSDLRDLDALFRVPVRFK